MPIAMLYFWQELAASQEAQAHLQQRLADLDGQQASAKEAALEQQLAETQRQAVSLQDQVDQLHQVSISRSPVLLILDRPIEILE